MQNNDKKYFIPVDGNPIEVSEEVYRAYYKALVADAEVLGNGYLDSSIFYLHKLRFS